MVMIVQIETVRMLIDAAQINGHLTEILATVFQWYFESSNRNRIKLDHANFGKYLGVVDADRVLFDLADIGATQIVQDTAKIFPIQCAAQTLAE